jgi:hypothetical protein
MGWLFTLGRFLKISQVAQIQNLQSSELAKFITYQIHNLASLEL